MPVCGLRLPSPQRMYRRPSTVRQIHSVIIRWILMCVVPLIVVVARNVVALLQGILKRRVAKGIDIIGMSSMSVNCVLVILKPFARVQITPTSQWIALYPILSTPGDRQRALFFETLHFINSFVFSGIVTDEVSLIAS